MQVLLIHLLLSRSNSAKFACRAAASHHSPKSLLLQNTILRRWDGTRIYFPNLKLQTTPLLNLSRSDSKVEIFKVSNSITMIAVGTACSAYPFQAVL